MLPEIPGTACNLHLISTTKHQFSDATLRSNQNWKRLQNWHKSEIICIFHTLFCRKASAVTRNSTFGQATVLEMRESVVCVFPLPSHSKHLRCSEGAHVHRAGCTHRGTHAQWHKQKLRENKYIKKIKELWYLQGLLQDFWWPATSPSKKHRDVQSCPQEPAEGEHSRDGVLRRLGFVLQTHISTH